MAPSTRLLIVDDDPSVRAMLREYLGNHGFEVSEAGSGDEMRAALDSQLPDLVLLDLRLPGEDGITLARFLRERYDVGIIMVTGSGDAVDRIVGLEVGADDYVGKPFDPRELLARVRSVLRRIQAKPPEVVATAPASAATAPSPIAPIQTTPRQPVGRCTLDVHSRRLFDGSGEELPLTAMEFELIKVFLANPNRVLTRDQLLQNTRNREWEPFDRSIDIRIGRLRRKIEPEDAAEPRFIRTVRNAGYMFVPGGE